MSGKCFAWKRSRRRRCGRKASILGVDKRTGWLIELCPTHAHGRGWKDWRQSQRAGERP